MILGALAVGFLAACAAAVARRPGSLPALLSGAMLVAGLAHAGWFKPRLAQIQAQPRKELAQFVSAALPESEPLGVYYAKRNSTIFYARRPIVDLGEHDHEFAGVVDFLSSPAPATLLTHEKFVTQLEESLPKVFVWTRRGHYVLVSNHRLHRPWPAPPHRPASTGSRAP